MCICIQAYDRVRASVIGLLKPYCPVVLFHLIFIHYLRRGGYVIVVVCLFVCLLATLRENFRTDLHEIFREGWQWANEQTVKFWWRT